MSTKPFPKLVTSLSPHKYPSTHPLYHPLQQVQKGDTITISDLSVDEAGYCRPYGTTKWFVIAVQSDGRMHLSLVGGNWDGYYLAAGDGWTVCVVGGWDRCRYLLVTRQRNQYYPKTITSCAGGTYYKLKKDKNYWKVGEQIE